MQFAFLDRFYNQPWCSNMCFYFLTPGLLVLLTQRFVLNYDKLNEETYLRSNTGLILGLRPANERRRYFVTTSLIDWAQAKNQLWSYIWVGCVVVQHLNLENILLRHIVWRCHGWRPCHFLWSSAGSGMAILPGYMMAFKSNGQQPRRTNGACNI